MLPGLDVDSIYRSLFAAYPDALLLVDGRGTIVLANPSATELLGYGADELIGLSVDALVPDAVRARHGEYRAAYGRQPRARPMGTQMELVARRRDGSEVMVEIALSPLAHTQPPLVVAAIRGIGTYPRVKQALQRARYSECVADIGRLAVDSRDPQQLLHAVPAAVVRTLGADGAVLHRLEPNRLELRVAASAGMAGLDDEGALLPNRHDTLHGFALAHDKPTVVTDWARETRFPMPEAYRQRGIMSSIVVPMSDLGRAIGLLAVHAAKPQASGDDEIHFLQSLCNLLTSSLQRAESEEALAHSQRLESVGQLTGGIAHDFNNLLTIIQGNLQVLNERPGFQGTDDELVASAMRAAKRAGELTGKLLAFSRRQVLQPARIDVRVMLHSLADMLKRTLDQRVRISVDVADGCPPVLADPSQLESALLNIAINARDAMPEGGTLAFSVQFRDGTVDVAVADSGAGMPDEVRERAFEPFFTTKAKGRGTGLGLSTVYGFVKQSKGSVELDSAPGRGTTVTIRLPQWHDAEAAAGPNTTGPLPELPRHLKVLLVEDEPEVRKVIGTFLDALGVKFTSAVDGEHALAWLASDGDVDLLLTDIALGPGMRGTDLAQVAQQRDPDLAVLLMSGFAPELLDPDADEPLPWELLRKPCTREELAAALARALAG
ncbi:MAG TPA: ATP-binding protein [Burkholderiaceae bacterium]|nr:ATP-binding protein [Burkholderiaceae bacterium]